MLSRLFNKSFNFHFNSFVLSSLILTSSLSFFEFELESVNQDFSACEIPLIVSSNNDESDSIQLVGGKAASLSHLQKVPGIVVPEWCCLTTRMYKQFIEENQLEEKIDNLDRISELWSASVKEEKRELEKSIYFQANELREAILAGDLSDEFYTELHLGYQALMERCGRPVAVAVRSSGVIEDLPDSSFAGIYDTYLNQKNEESVIDAVKRCWASVFNDRAIFERNSRRIRHTDALASVIIQQMINPKASGTAFNMEIGTGYKGIEIAANYGLGETVVGGEVSVDKWLVNPATNGIIKATLGNKKFKILSDPDKSGVEIVLNSEAEKDLLALDDAMVQEIASCVKEIGDHYFRKFSYPHIDTEFAVDRDGKLYFLQARPLVSVVMNDMPVLDKEDAKNHQIIGKGRFSVPGVAWGKVKVISTWKDLADGNVVIEPEDIAVTHVSSNSWSQYMTAFKGMITEEGGPTSHPILLCRERRVPCVIGIASEVFEKLVRYDGQYVTIDGINQTIYEGKVQFTTASPEDFSSQFEVVKEEKFASFDDLAQELLKFGLLKVEEQNGQKVYWQKKPNCRLDKILQDINILSYRKKAALLGMNEPSEVKVVDNIVMERFISNEEKFMHYQGMDLERCEELVLNHESICNAYLEFCNSFTLTPTEWKRYVEIASELRSYNVIGFSFRDYVNRQAIRLAERLQIPKYYMEAYSEQLQSTLLEEDSLIVKAILELARKIQYHARMNPKASITLLQLQKQAPEIYQDLVSTAKQYRFQKDISFIPDVDVEQVLKRVLIEIEKRGEEEIPELNIASTVSKNGINDHYFPLDDELRRWIYLGVKSRVLQSNCHHIMIRGQWKIREALLELGQRLVEQGKLNQRKDIFNLSADEVARLV